ncbi:gamma-glutamyltranspeptidase/glutathione hydrolase [Silvibacterium bohemicum]|uniref:Glutathione hydrolase proenzyme n=1 Tax=Silvibacterium bohemicum TaxID=1577686 RepID=A0A841K024_9BACT|nr:gamma-glutamyltransferase [Silvibacterium bohemicum]MBB6146916.1 gamma-glutamyltranspeptidase/glutathione hydrolase [Silvibacterium bohemicum]
MPRPLSQHLTSLALAVFLLSSFALHAQDAAPDDSKKEATAARLAGEQPVRTKHAMVVSIHHLATDAGVEILKEGGNAVDAAVATGFALAVVHPAAGNLGGGGFMLVHFAEHGSASGKDTFIDYRERAPQGATTDMYLDAQGNVIPDASITGYKAIGVPGSVAGMVYAEKKYGALTLAKVMAPAIRLASEGFVLTDEEANELHDTTLTMFPESQRIFQRDGDFYKAGDRFKQPELGATLRTIAGNPDDFYRGSIAKKLVADIHKGGGLITAEDLARYSVKEREPLTGGYKGYTIVSAPPPSSGGIALIETLNILDGYNLARWKDRTPDEMHLIVEAFRRAYMDRTDYLGDPDYVKIPIDQLADPKYAAAWRTSIVDDQATPSKDLKRPARFLPPPPTMSDVRHESTQTTHFSVMDADGNAVSVTTTLNNSFGSAVTAEGLGFLLNDEMDDFASKQGVPNMFGLIQGPANAIAPGKRPLSSMTPTIVLKDGKVRFVLGSPGGGRIITTVANIFLSVADEGLNIQQAVDAPRFHHQYLPDVLSMEPGFSDSTVEGLRAMGYQLKIGGHWSDGECIAVDPESGELEGGQDHRHHFGKAAGY